MSEKTLIKNFIINPKSSTYEMIKNKELALSKLAKVEDTEEKIAFLILITEQKMKFFNIVEKNFIDLFSSTVDNSIMNKKTL